MGSPFPRGRTRARSTSRTHPSCLQQSSKNRMDTSDESPVRSGVWGCGYSRISTILPVGARGVGLGEGPVRARQQTDVASCHRIAIIDINFSTGYACSSGLTHGRHGDTGAHACAHLVWGAHKKAVVNLGCGFLGRDIHFPSRVDRRHACVDWGFKWECVRRDTATSNCY